MLKAMLNIISSSSDMIVFAYCDMGELPKKVNSLLFYSLFVKGCTRQLNSSAGVVSL